MQFNTTHFLRFAQTCHHNGFQFSAIFAQIFRKSRDFRKKSQVLSGTSLLYLFCFLRFFLKIRNFRSCVQTWTYLVDGWETN